MPILLKVIPHGRPAARGRLVLHVNEWPAAAPQTRRDLAQRSATFLAPQSKPHVAAAACVQCAASKVATRVQCAVACLDVRRPTSHVTRHTSYVKRTSSLFHIFRKDVKPPCAESFFNCSRSCLLGSRPLLSCLKLWMLSSSCGCLARLQP